MGEFTGPFIFERAATYFVLPCNLLQFPDSYFFQGVTPSKEFAVLLKLVSPVLAISIALGSPSDAPAPDPAQPPELTAYPADLTPGQLKIATVDELRFARDGRDMPLPLKIRHPIATQDQPGPFPLVVFSHGMGGYTDAFEYLSAHLASHGYVVIHPAHTDSIHLRREAGDSADSLRQTFTRDGTSVVDLLSRIDDCLWITTNLDAIEERLFLPGLIDRERTAMAGHSAGAMTTQTLGGLRFQTPRTGRSMTLADGEAFEAFVVISGQGTTQRLINEQSWQGIRKPMLVISGSEDTSRVSDETPESRRHPYEFAPDGSKYLIHIKGATHGSYQGGAAPNADEDRIQALTTHATLAFLDFHLRKNESARNWLLNASPTKFAGTTAEYATK